jgi:Mn-dependent DtxR family transcriptional regulator
VPHLSARHLAALDLIVAEGQTTARQAAEVLGVTRPTVSAILRALERAGHLHGELVGGGELGYTATASGEHHAGHRNERSPAAGDPARGQPQASPA